MEKIHHTDVAERLKFLVDTSPMSRAQFARRIGLDPSNFSKYLLGRLPVPPDLVNRVALDLGVSRSWLRDGVGTPYEKELHMRPIDTTSSELPMQADGIPVYNIDAMAGAMPLSREFTVDRVIGRVSLPRLHPDSMFIRVSGDSMEPVLKPGSYINIRRITDPSIIVWGQIYVVVLEDYRLVKFVRRNPDPAVVTLRSANTDYDDIDIPRSAILDLYIVEAVLNYDERC